MSALDIATRNLVIANRILANEGVLDAYGHVSTRHPELPHSFLLSRSRSPELVTVPDIIVHRLDGVPEELTSAPLYMERFIHAAIYEVRPDVMAVVHSHAEDVLPFTLGGTPMKPVYHAASGMGDVVPTWDIRDAFGDGTNLLVADIYQGRSFARCIAGGWAGLMRSHGFSALGRSLPEAVILGVYIPANARVQFKAHLLGGDKSMSSAEIAARATLFDPARPEMWRAWEYWARRAGCSDLLQEDAVNNW